MELDGKIIIDLGLQSGTSKAGREWKKREWVLETFGQYPRKVKFHVFGDKADTIGIEVGNSYTLSVDVESREFNDRWYTDVSCFAARPYAPGQPAGYPQPAYAPQGYPQQAYPQQPYAQAPAQPYQQGAPQAFGGDAFPPAPTPGAPSFEAAGDATDDLPF